MKGASMRNSHRIWLAFLILGSISNFAPSSFATPQTAGSSDVPVVKGGAGSCTADFVVKDGSGKGIYDAKIEIQIKYGTFGLHKLDATVGTNSDGKGRIEGLPEHIRKTAEFKVTHGGQTKTLPFDPESDCHPHPEVVLEDK
jgi:hypothetical protein